MKKRLILTAVVAAFPLGGLQAAYDGNLLSERPIAEADFTAWLPAAGTVQSVDNEKGIIEIQTQDGTNRQFAVANDAYLEKNDTRGAELTDFQPGDEVVVHYLRDSLLATSVQSLDQADAS